MRCEICNVERDNFHVWGRGKLCHNCTFWQPFLSHKLGLRHRGVHYMVFGDLEPNVGGMPGTFEFTLVDGRVIMSQNISCQGAIPRRFMDELFDNVLIVRTTWRNLDDLPASLGFGNCLAYQAGSAPVTSGAGAVVRQLSKLKQPSLF